jgi:hypothetical protein
MGHNLISPEFYQIPRDVAENTEPHEAFVYAVIYWFYAMKDGRCYASNERIMQSLPYKSSIVSVSNAVKSLSEKGLIRCVYKGAGNRNRVEIIPLVVYTRRSQSSVDSPTDESTIHAQVNRDSPTGEQIYINNKKELPIRDEAAASRDVGPKTNGRRSAKVVVETGVSGTETPTADEQLAAPFDSTVYFKEILKDKTNLRHVRIISLFVLEKNRLYGRPKITTKQEAQATIRRYVKTAKSIAEYADKHISESMYEALERMKEETTLETVYKYITK